MVELMGLGGQTGFNIPETVAITELGETHTEELIPTGEGPDAVVPLVFGDEFTKLVAWNEIYNLSKHRASGCHEQPPLLDGYPKANARPFGIEKNIYCYYHVIYILFKIPCNSS